MFDKELERWKELDPKKRAFFVVFIIFGVVFLYLNHQKNVAAESAAEKVRLEKVAAEESGKTTGPKYNFSALPQTQRNQGLEDLSLEIQKLRDELSSYRQGHGNPVAPVRDPLATPPAYAPKAVDLNQKLPETAASQAAPAFDVDALEAKTNKGAPAEGAVDVNQPTVRPRARMKAWPASENQPVGLSKSNEPKLVIPINSALEAVMLTGINARPSGAIGSAVGSPRSAKTVGAPFVTKIKGDATLPNGWKLAVVAVLGTIGALNGGTALTASAWDAIVTYLRSMLSSTYVLTLIFIALLVMLWQLTHGRGWGMAGVILGVMAVALIGPGIVTAAATATGTPGFVTVAPQNGTPQK